MNNSNDQYQMDLGIDEINIILHPPVLVDVEIIKSIPTKRESFRQCMHHGKKNLKQVAGYLKISVGYLSKIFNDEGKNLPDEKLTDLMNFCGNLIPLQWEAGKAGHTLTPNESEIEKKLHAVEEERNELEKKLEHFIEYSRLQNIKN